MVDHMRVIILTIKSMDMVYLYGLMEGNMKDNYFKLNIQFYKFYPSIYSRIEQKVFWSKQNTSYYLIIFLCFNFVKILNSFFTHSIKIDLF